MKNPIQSHHDHLLPPPLPTLHHRQEQLRRLKKQYWNVLSKIGLEKEYVFKSLQDQATVEISNKIWSSSTDHSGDDGGVDKEGRLEDDESNPNVNLNANPNLFDHNSNSVVDPNSSEKICEVKSVFEAVTISVRLD
ncbi:putative transcription factor [Camellia lanceoleosa]|uniref:Transcription factor n=1 Tax=Camellia lanceoleosa TaxID=1840588 RepID=A0ACC0ICC3_9ERIC|nr:putative transcription factor [Camellia lanceoleosa]